MKRFLAFLVVLVLTFIAQAQSPIYRVISIPVQKNGVQLRDPWAGGMDSPQFSTGDLNGDGIPDLFVFDRVGDRVFTYLGNGGAPDTMFTYAPQYEGQFASGINSWALLRDYNNDGVPDIFTHANAGVAVYKGTRNGSVIHFDMASSLLKYHYSAGFPRSNLYVNSLDIPGIIDVNGDGDLDILVYNIPGGTTVGYYENQTMEHAGDPGYAYDSLKYNLATTCWGDFSQNPGSNSTTLHIGPLGCQVGDSVYSPIITGGGIDRHSGNSLYPIIDPVTGYIDLLNGNIGYNNLMFLRADSSRHYPYGHMYLWDSIFPNVPCSNPIVQFYYPAGYGINVSSNSYEDLLVSSNIYAPYIYTGGSSPNVNNVMWYKNLHDSICYYEYEGDSFLVHHMLDFGSNSRGVFYDFNGDGLTDIVVGSFGYFDPTFSPTFYHATLAWYQNIGTATQPSFQQVTLDYDSFSNYHLPGTSPAFGDLDGDGHPDMLVGDNSGYLYYFKNTASTGSSYPTMTASHFNNLKVSAYAAPFIYDLDGDSLPDLLIGADDGYIHYYKNTGTKNNPVFSAAAKNDTFGHINVCFPGFINAGFAQPSVVRDNTGALILYIGSGRGTIFKYKINTDSLMHGHFDLIDSNIIGHRVGANATVSVADITNDGKMEYLMGTSTGGLLLYSDSNIDPKTSLGIDEVPLKQGQLKIYPNPAKDYFICTAAEMEFINPKAEVYNVLGEKVNAEIKFNDNKLLIGTQNLPSGFYLVKIVDEGITYPGKVLIEK